MMPPGTASMLLSGTTKRWLLGAGAACAGLGLALKLGDLVGLAATAVRPEIRELASASRSRSHPRDGGEATPPASVPARPASPTPVEGRDPVEVALPSARPSGSGVHAPAAHAPEDTRAPARRPRPRTRNRAKREAGSLDVATARRDGPTELQPPASPPSGTRLDPGSTPTQEAAPEPPPAAVNGFETAESELPLDGRVEVPELGAVAGSRGTVSLWLQPQWQPGNQDDATLAQLGDTLQLVKNVNFVRFELLHAEGMLGVGAPVNEWQAGEWHLLTATWNRNELSLYLDGTLVNQTVQPIPIDLPKDTTLFVGSDFPESRPVAPGVIGKVGLWGRPLGPEEVAAAYKSATENVR